FYQKNAENQEQNSKQRHNPVAPQFGNFWGQPGSFSGPMLCSYQDGRMPNNNGNNSEEQKPVSSNHNLLSEEMNFQKKHQTASEQPDAFSKSSDGGAKNAPISISMDDGSTGENEDVVAQCEDSAKGSVVNKGSDRKRSADDTAVDFQGKRQPMVVPYQVPAQVSGPPTVTNAPNFHPVCTVQLRPPTNGGLAVQTMGNASQVACGYPAVQLPTLETISSWAFGAPPQVVSCVTAKGKAEQTGSKQTDDGKEPQ
ncbi:hypothetical protein ACJX0J_029806, partial [Zea mays]